MFIKSDAVKSFRTIEFWAENGVIYVLHKGRAEKTGDTEDNTAEHLRGLPPKEFLRRALAAACLEYNQNLNYPSELKQIKQFIADAKNIYEKAKDQGAYDDPEVDAWKQRHNVYKPARIVVPHNVNFKKRSTEDIMLDGVEYA